MRVTLPLEGRTSAALQISKTTMTTTITIKKKKNRRVSSSGTKLRDDGMKTQHGDDPAADLMMLSTQLIC